MHDSQAGLAGLIGPCSEDSRERPFPYADSSGIGLDDAGQDLDQGRLARPVSAHEAVHLSAIDSEAHVDQCQRRTERLGDAVEAQGRALRLDPAYGQDEPPQAAVYAAT